MLRIVNGVAKRVRQVKTLSLKKDTKKLNPARGGVQFILIRFVEDGFYRGVVLRQFENDWENRFTSEVIQGVRINPTTIDHLAGLSGQPLAEPFDLLRRYQPRYFRFEEPSEVACEHLRQVVS